MRTYYVSTPRFTVLVDVHQDGTITHTAPSLRRTWQGRPWGTLTAQLARQYGAALRITQLLPLGERG